MVFMLLNHSIKCIYIFCIRAINTSNNLKYLTTIGVIVYITDHYPLIFEIVKAFSKLICIYIYFVFLEFFLKKKVYKVSIYKAHATHFYHLK
jgi:hypothetical protein